VYRNLIARGKLTHDGQVSPLSMLSTIEMLRVSKALKKFFQRFGLRIVGDKNDLGSSWDSVIEIEILASTHHVVTKTGLLAFVT